MKMIVKLTVLLAALLLLTGVAFADDCYCYDIHFTYLDDPALGPPHNLFRLICFDSDNVGSTRCWCNPPHIEIPVYMFFDVRKRAIMYIDSEYGTCTASFEFHGGIDGVTGIYTNIESGIREEFHGHKVDEENCVCGGGG